MPGLKTKGNFAGLSEGCHGNQVTAFQRILREEYGVFCTVRQEMGQDISGAH